MRNYGFGRRTLRSCATNHSMLRRPTYIRRGCSRSYLKVSSISRCQSMSVGCPSKPRATNFYLSSCTNLLECYWNARPSSTRSRRYCNSYSHSQTKNGTSKLN